MFGMGLFFMGIGIHHFIDPTPYLAIMPPYLPAPPLLVQVSGFFEILGGVGLCITRTRTFAAWGLIALLIAVFPVHIHMLVNDVYLPDMPRERWLLWARMPVQFVLAAAVMWTGGIWHPSTRSQ